MAKGKVSGLHTLAYKYCRCHFHTVSRYDDAAQIDTSFLLSITVPYDIFLFSTAFRHELLPALHSAACILIYDLPSYRCYTFELDIYSPMTATRRGAYLFSKSSSAGAGDERCLRRHFDFADYCFNILLDDAAGDAVFAISSPDVARIEAGDAMMTGTAQMCARRRRRSSRYLLITLAYSNTTRSLMRRWRYHRWHTPRYGPIGRHAIARAADSLDAARCAPAGASRRHYLITRPKSLDASFLFASTNARR